MCVYSMGVQHHSRCDHQSGRTPGCGCHPHHAEGLLQPPAPVPSGPGSGGPVGGRSPSSFPSCM